MTTQTAPTFTVGALVGIAVPLFIVAGELLSRGGVGERIMRFARTLFGFLPVGLLGAMGYVAILVAWGIVRFTSGMAGRMAALMLFLMVLFGVLFSIYLTYLELYVIRAVCAWCLSSAVIMALLMVLVVRPAIDAVQGDDLGE